MQRKRAKNNRTLELNSREIEALRAKLIYEKSIKKDDDLINKTLNEDIFTMLKYIPDNFADLIIVDPPYNITKNFNGIKFNSMSQDSYYEYLQTWFPNVCRKLKSTGSLYMCGDWKCTSSLQRVIEEQLTIINRITWQREKGRGAKQNWKNCMEDIWFAVKNPNDYYFNVESVMMKRKVLAPYKINGKPKDWNEENEGNFRLTHPSNFWDDISIPFWSMPENTKHPTQKSEKLYAKVILASSKESDIVFDPLRNISLGRFIKVNAKSLGEYQTSLNDIYERCCGFINAHSNPEPVDNNPSIEDLKADFETFKNIRSKFIT